MASDIDRRFNEQVEELHSEISRVDGIIGRHPHNSRTGALREYRRELVNEVTKMERGGRAFDLRLKAAMEDETGQDMDALEYDAETLSEHCNADGEHCW